MAGGDEFGGDHGRSPRPQTGGVGGADFGSLYDLHHQRLFRLALLLCHGNRQTAEDAVAETFLRIYRAWPAEGIDDFFAYARRALVNHVIGQARREQTVTRYLARQSGADAVSTGAEDRVVDSAATFELLARLPPRQRTAIVLRFYEDLPYDQIAAELGVSTGTIKAHVSTGLQRLRTLLEGDAR